MVQKSCWVIHNSLVLLFEMYITTYMTKRIKIPKNFPASILIIYCRGLYHKEMNYMHTCNIWKTFLKLALNLKKKKNPSVKNMLSYSNLKGDNFCVWSSYHYLYNYDVIFRFSLIYLGKCYKFDFFRFGFLRSHCASYLVGCLSGKIQCIFICTSEQQSPSTWFLVINSTHM